MEYANSVRELVGEVPDLTRDFPLDSLKHGFDNNSEHISISTPQVDAYRNAAEQVAALVIGDAARRARVVGCEPTGAERANCLRSFVQRFGRLAWRRALSGEEVNTLVGLADVASADQNPYQSVALVLRAVLQSPDFLFRVEDSGGAQNKRALNGYELASRLSYALWQSSPDEALLSAAEAGELSSPDGLRAQTQRMLEDPRAKMALRRFHQGWLRLDLLGRARVNTTEYPLWTEGLRASLQEEVLRFMEDLTWKQGSNYLDLLSSSSTRVDDKLAQLYGVPAPATPWSPVSFPAEQRRSGLLTMGAVLALTGRPEGTTPIIRGRYVREVLLCQQLASPPPNIPAIPAPVAGETERQRLDRHRTDPACAGCHVLLDPVGFGLAQFDQIGRYAPKDANGAAIDTKGSLYGYPAAEFDGPNGLSNALNLTAEVPTCVSTELFRYLFGRSEMPQDGCTIFEAERRFRESNFDFPTLLTAYMTSDAFRYRTSEADSL